MVESFGPLPCTSMLFFFLPPLSLLSPISRGLVITFPNGCTDIKWEKKKYLKRKSLRLPNVITV